MSLQASRAGGAGFRRADHSAFTFGRATLAADGAVELEYALGDELRFCERWSIPLAGGALGEEARAGLAPLLRLLHLVAGVSYYKAAAPDRVVVGGPAPGPAQARLLDALYSQGLGEFAYRNGLDALPRPRLPGRAPPPRRPAAPRRPGCSSPSAAARTRSSRSRSRGARARTSRCSPSATRFRSRARRPSPGCRG